MRQPRSRRCLNQSTIRDLRSINPTGLRAPNYWPKPALTARLGTRPPRQALGRAGSSVTLALPGVPSGWWTLSAELAPDELRADDQRTGVVRVAPVARVAWDTAAHHVAAACEVLAANRRIARGDEVTFGRLGSGPTDVPVRLMPITAR